MGISMGGPYGNRGGWLHTQRAANPRCGWQFRAGLHPVNRYTESPPPLPSRPPPRPRACARGLQVTDAVYMGLGRVLTISGRTIRPEAQASPQPAQEAEGAIDKFLAQVGAKGVGRSGVGVGVRGAHLQ